MSMIKNGTNIRKPISNARRSSLIINAGIATFRGVSSMLSAGFSPLKSLNNNKSFSLVFLTMNSLMGLAAFSKPSITSIFSSIIGLMPSSHDFSKVGLIMNNVRNKASETKTMLGGVALVARALRVMENTTIIRVKDVIIIRIDGANDNTVIIIRTLKILPVAVPSGVSPKLMFRHWAKAGSVQQSAAKIKTKMAKSDFLFIFFILAGVGLQQQISGLAEQDQIFGLISPKQHNLVARIDGAFF